MKYLIEFIVLGIIFLYLYDRKRKHPEEFLTLKEQREIYQRNIREHNNKVFEKVKQENPEMIEFFGANITMDIIQNYM